VEIPDFSGADRTTAVRQLDDLGFKTVVNGEPNNDFTPNTVIRTEPASGERVDRGSQVRVIVAQRSNTVTVPNVIGQSQESGTAILEGDGFRVSSREEENSAPAGLIIDQSPGPDSEASAGDTVSIVVSSGTSGGGGANPGEGDSAPPAPEGDG
jgi:serine/threonine-protein kinase